MDPFVSIIVPVYKVPEVYLRKCIESLMSQTLKEVEIILVDDGSPDRCGEICEEYGLRDPRVKVIRKQNGGLSAARNTGFFAATGQFVMFVDGDDWTEPNMCEEMYRYALDKQVQLVQCGFAQEYEKKSKIYTIQMENGKVYSGRECAGLRVRLLDFNSNLATAYGKLIDRTFLLENNIIHDEALRQGAEGLEFNFRLFHVLGSASFLNRTLYHYRYNPFSISAKTDESNNELVLKCFDKIKQMIQDDPDREALMKSFYNRMVYVIITTAVSGYFHPDYHETYTERKKSFAKYLLHPLIQETMENANLKNLSIQRKIIMFFIRYKTTPFLYIAGYMRKLQKQ